MLCCVIRIFLQRQKYTYLLAPDREHTTNQSMNTTEVQLGGPMSFIWVTYRNKDERLLRVDDSKMTQRQLTKVHSTG